MQDSEWVGEFSQNIIGISLYFCQHTFFKQIPFTILNTNSKTDSVNVKFNVEYKQATFYVSKSLQAASHKSSITDK